MNHHAAWPLLALILLAGCGGGTAAPLEPLPPPPPAGSGRVTIDMTGVWRVVSVFSAVDTGGPEPVEQGARSGEPSLMPPVPGTELHIDGGRFVLGARREMRLERMAPAGRPRAYANFADGRIAFYLLHVVDRPRNEPVAESDLELILGSVDDLRMLGLVRHRLARWIDPLGVPASDGEGLHAIELRRLPGCGVR